MIKHNGPFLDNREIPYTIDQINKIFPLDLNTYPSLEGQVANISDDIAYLTHDFDDGLREGLFTINDLRKIKIIDDNAEICFDEPQFALAPGQAAVFYEGSEVLGGGWITST